MKNGGCTFAQKSNAKKPNDQMKIRQMTKWKIMTGTPLGRQFVNP